MIVTPTGDRLCYNVTSDKHPEDDPYLVDLEDNGYMGKCSCTDFEKRSQPKLIRAGKATCYRDPERNVCKHIDAVHTWLSQTTIARVAKVPRTQLFKEEIYV